MSAAVQRLCSSNPRTIAELAQLRSVCLEGGVGFQVQVEVCGVLRMQRSEALHLVGPRSDNLASVSGGWWRVRPHDFAKAFVPGGLRCVQILSISSHESSSFLVRCAAVCILKLIFAVFGCFISRLSCCHEVPQRGPQPCVLTAGLKGLQTCHSSLSTLIVLLVKSAHRTHSL